MISLVVMAKRGTRRRLQALEIGVPSSMPVPHALVALHKAGLHGLCPIVQPFSSNLPTEAHQNAEIVDILESRFVFFDPALLLFGRRSAFVGARIFVVRSIVIVDFWTAEVGIRRAILEITMPLNRSLEKSIRLHGGTGEARIELSL